MNPPLSPQAFIEMRLQVSRPGSGRRLTETILVLKELCVPVLVLPRRVLPDPECQGRGRLGGRARGVAVGVMPLGGRPLGLPYSSMLRLSKGHAP